VQTKTRMIRLLLLSSLLALAGCFSLSREAPAQKYYVLGAGGRPRVGRRHRPSPMPSSGCVHPASPST
jgi:hypothetical protein